MALPANIESTELLQTELSDMKGVLNRLLFKSETSTAHLSAIRTHTEKQSVVLDDLHAAAELLVDELANIEAERVDGAAQTSDADGEKQENDGPDQNLIALKDIRSNTKKTAEAVKVLADEAKERKEDILVPPQDLLGGPLMKGKGKEGDEDAVKDKDSKSGISALLAAVIGTYIGIIGSFFAVWFKALKFVFNKPFKMLGNFFKKLIPSGANKNGLIAKGFEKLQDFFKRMRNFFRPLGRIFLNIFKFMAPILGVAGRVMAVLNPIGLIVVALLTAFEAFKGFLEGFKEGGIIGAFRGAFEGMFDFLISAPANLLKDLIGWIAGMLGFDNFKAKLDSFDFAVGDVIDAISNALTNIKNWFLGGLAGIGIPPFEFTIPIVGKKIKFDGFYPFAGLAPEPKVEGDDQQTLDVDMGANKADSEISKYKQEVASQEEAGGEVMAVKLPEDFAKKELQGKKAVVTGETFRGGYKMITEDGKKVRISPSLRREVDSILEGGEEVGGDASMQDSSSDTSGQINSMTDATNDARDGSSNGGNFNIGGNSSAIDNSRSSSNEQNIYYGKVSNSLAGRGGVILPR